MGVTAMAALSHLAEGECRLVDLAKVIHITGAAMTGLADLLEKRGLATRKIRHGDRRVQLLSLTDEGKQVAARINAILNGGKV